MTIETPRIGSFHQTAEHQQYLPGLVFGQGFFQPQRAKTWQDGIFLCLKQRKLAGILIVCNHLIVTVPYVRLERGCILILPELVE